MNLIIYMYLWIDRYFNEIIIFWLVLLRQSVVPWLTWKSHRSTTGVQWECRSWIFWCLDPSRVHWSQCPCRWVWHFQKWSLRFSCCWVCWPWCRQGGWQWHRTHRPSSHWRRSHLVECLWSIHFWAWLAIWSRTIPQWLQRLQTSPLCKALVYTTKGPTPYINHSTLHSSISNWTHPQS